ncbi:DUF748 domain-containing protein [Aquabacterium sp. A08]|uniref:DUF748 domain-containing protein n=1 Tax=Aquabacterium sp. A08 TaxID=2718532 RepID=UPI00142066C5|nr:DUF748 domain-containing protein [Aquabacterium sp. A08]NIC40625.1 DUF748 domain-containing protein [Aquabacterium sp. A08]
MNPLFTSRWARRAGIAAALLLGLWLLAWLGGPPLLRWQIEQQASQALGRPVQVGEVTFRPWSLELRLRQLRIGAAPDAADAEPLLTVDELYLDAELQSLLRLAPVVDAVQVRTPRLHLTHLGAGRYDIDDVLARLRQPDEAPTEPPRFAVFNIALSDGQVTFHDAPRGVRHTLDGAQLHIPFLSNLGARRDVVTTPHLAFRLNGTAFDSRAETTPFADDHQTQAHLTIDALDLAPYLPYWPSQWPLRPHSAQLDADLTLSFEQAEQPRVGLAGDLTLSRLQLTERSPTGDTDLPLFALQRLHLQLADVRPLDRHLGLGTLELDGPTLHLRRDARGALNLHRLQQAWQGPAAPETAPAPNSGPGWTVALPRLQVSQGTLHWADASTRPAAALSAEQIELTVQDAAWPAERPMALRGGLSLAGTPVAWEGQASGSAAELRLTTQGLPLPAAAPYLAAVLRPALAGQLHADATLRWQAARGDTPAQLALQAPSLALTGLRLGPPQRPQASLQSLALQAVQVDLLARRATIGQVRLDQPTLQLQRQRDGRWMFEDWWPTAAADPPPTPTATSSPSNTTPPWDLAVEELLIAAGTVSLRDASVGNGTALDATQLTLQVRQLRPLAAQQAPMPVRLLGRLAQPRREPGRLAFDGTLRLPGAARQPTPLDTRGQLRLERLPLHALEPYLAEVLNFELLRADASYRGRIALALPSAGPTLELQGNAALEDLKASTRDPSEDLLDWKALNLRGLDLAVEGGQLRRLAIAETVLSDYFARVVIDPSGRINLQGLVGPPAHGAQARAATEPSGALPPSGPDAGPRLASPPPPGPPDAAASPPQIDFGPIALVNGRVRFSDRFVQPNYTANLSELSGSLAAFSNRPGSDSSPTLAELTLRGRVEGSATLDVSGRLNPLAQPLALDIRGQVRDLELPPLTPYSSKYAGYGIERGKLSVDVTYRIDPSGQLQASNQIVLNQLRFGDRVEGSDAPNLPVKLAVALLADRNGVIDINLPISGSLNDPQFRLGPIIVRLVVNLIGKAITAPFALIANALGGGDSLQQVAFAPGSARLDPDARQALDRVAQALLDRPALQLTVVGHSQLDAERAGFRRLKLDSMVAAEKRRRALRDGQDGSATAPVSAEEYPALLKEVYRRADIAKPRNLVGLAKDLPLADMEALLLAAVPVTDADMRELAVARGVAVKDYLAGRQVPAERLFLGANGAPPATDAEPAARAELKLSVN